MANEQLKNALRDAGLTPEEFAEIVRVDPKTVGRWLAGATTPYPRHRASIARALDLTEHQLWPDETPAPAPAPGPAGHDAAPGSEMTGAWAYDTDETAPDPITFVTATAGAIDLIDNGRGIQLTKDLLAALAEQANAGRHVRLLTGHPKPRLEPLIGRERIEICVIDAGPEHSLLRVGDTMLLTFNLSAEADRPPPLLKLQRTAEGGLFDRLADNIETLARDAIETLTTIRQLDAYFTNADEDDLYFDDDDPHDDFEDEDPSDRAEPSELTAADPPAPAPTVATPIRSDPDQAERRWPRRPS